MSNTVTVKYRTKRDCCQCCGQKLENPQISEVREFIFSKDNCLEWMDEESWQIEKGDEDEFQILVEDFVYETIDFFAISSGAEILIDSSEFEKVKKLILEEIVA